MHYPSHSRHQIRSVAGFVLTLFVSTIVVIAQQNIDPIANNSVQSPVADLITVQVSVTDGRGNHLIGLSKDNFTLLINDKPKDIALFSDRDEPGSICVVFDTSNSMNPAIGETDQVRRLRVANLIPERLAAMSHPSNEYFLITFNERPSILLDGVSRDKFTAGLSRPPTISIKGETAIYDALRLAIERLMEAAHRKRVILLITDEGEDNASQTKWSEVKKLVGVSGISIYVISVGDYYRTDAEGSSVAEELVKLTGAAGFYPRIFQGHYTDTAKKLEEFASFVTRDIRNQYTLGFTAIPADDKWHQIKVKVTLPPNNSTELKRVVVRSREKYYAGPNSR